MTEQECENAFQQLEKAMNSSGLGWVTTQVSEEIRFGRLTTKRIAAHPDLPEDLALEVHSEPRRKSKIEVPATREYTANEKLKLLVAAIQQAIVAPEEMQKSIRHSVSGAAPKWRQIRLIRTDEAARDAVVLGRTVSEERSRGISELQRLITALRNMI